MKYSQIENTEVFTEVTKGNNVVICDFDENVIKHTNALTVNDIRTYIAHGNVVFMKAVPEA